MVQAVATNLSQIASCSFLRSFVAVIWYNDDCRQQGKRYRSTVKNQSNSSNAM